MASMSASVMIRYSSGFLVANFDDGFVAGLWRSFQLLLPTDLSVSMARRDLRIRLERYQIGGECIMPPLFPGKVSKEAFVGKRGSSPPPPPSIS